MRDAERVGIWLMAGRWCLGYCIVNPRSLQFLARKAAFAGPVRGNHSAGQIFSVWSAFSSDRGRVSVGLFLGSADLKPRGQYEELNQAVM